MATVFKVRAHAEAREFSLALVSETPLVLRADIPEKAEHNRANSVLLEKLEKALACRVEILAGQKSRKKTLAADCTAERIVRIMKMKK